MEKKNVLKLISPMPVSTNLYLKAKAVIIYIFDKFTKKKKPVAKVSMYETAEAKKYKKLFLSYAKKEIQRQIDEGFWNLDVNDYQHFYVDCVFYFDRTNKDANNHFKIMIDTLTDTQMIWHDDNVVAERVNRIYYDTENPRIELTIYPVDYIGIFDNLDILIEFEDNCKTCSRYKRNCSILRKAKEGRIQDEINSFMCSKYKENKKIKEDKRRILSC